MRKTIEKQPQIGQVDIPSIQIDITFRDEIPQMLLGLQTIYCGLQLRGQIFNALKDIIPRNVDTGNGRPVMSLWKILVLGTLRVIVSLGYNPIWFCIASMKLAEIGAVTPPVGLNAFSLKGVAGKDVSIEDVFSGVFPFILCDVAVLILLFIFPDIVLWLPRSFMGH